jgi:murein DD-endopeptidase MepM/ murein hydrolase activator NlpD
MRFLIIFLLYVNTIISQNAYPKDYFRSPMDIPLSISGSFGELRPNHFHSGLDFRTEKREGLPIYAAADGYISRIKISNSGYGKVIYINHPNGYTSVYGHLQKCNPTIQEMLKKEHYTKKIYEIEIYPTPAELPVKKGDLIAYSGNTGSSGGPHLHFEFRDTTTEMVINPLFFGLNADVKDDKAPQITGLMAYSIGDSSQVNGSTKPVMISLSLQKDGSYLAGKVLASGKIGFSVNTFDTANDTYNKNGIYKLDTYMNGLPYFGFEFDSFSFDETRYINTFIDYSVYESQKQRYQKLFLGYTYPNNIIKVKKNDGIINVSSNFTMNYKIVIQDFVGNKTVVNVPISYANLPIVQKEEVTKTNFFLKARNDNSYVKDNVSVFIPEKTFFEDFYLKFDVINNELFLHDKSQAVNGNISISYDVSDIPAAEREKMFIANLNNGRTIYHPTYKKDDAFSIKTKNLGKFFLAKDETAPKIYKPNFTDGANLDEQKTLQISISDDMSGIKEYNAFLNGQWILMEYENKNNRLTHYLSDNMYQIGKNELKVIVTDNLGNSTTFETSFLRTK